MILRRDSLGDELLDYKLAVSIAHRLGTPSKMPGYAYGIPARNCPIGSLLVKVNGSVCSTCYALKGRYVFSNVLAAQEKRLKSLPHPLWARAITSQIYKHDQLYFRWHDSGDLQGAWHLAKIVEVAQRCVHVNFWLPTREARVVREFGAVPPNLLIRVSGTMINGPPPLHFPHTSTVTTGHASCPAQYQGGQCGHCRACWDPAVPTVSYPKH